MVLMVTPVAEAPPGTRMPMECDGDLLFTQLPWLFFTGVATSEAVPARHAVAAVSGNGIRVGQSWLTARTRSHVGSLAKVDLWCAPHDVPPFTDTLR